MGDKKILETASMSWFEYSLEVKDVNDDKAHQYMETLMGKVYAKEDLKTLEEAKVLVRAL